MNFVALLALILLLLAAPLLAKSWAVRLEQRYARRMAPNVDRQRDLGVALAKAALALPGMLPVYGSSELERPLPFLVSDFYRDGQYGFTVCPEGRRGASPLLLLQKMASVGHPPAGDKAVLILSPVWFLSNGEAQRLYAGNFSALQEMSTIFKARLSPTLRRDIARRMLQYPDTLANAPILNAGLDAAATSDTWIGSLSFRSLLPLERLITNIKVLQDHFESVREIATARPPRPAPAAQASSAPDWNAIIAHADAEAPRSDDPDPAGMKDDLSNCWDGVRQMATCTEWADLELMLRVSQELKIKLLLLNIPWSAPYYDQRGVSAGLRSTYYARLRSIAGTYHVPFVAFQDHEYDGNFLHDRHSHLSAKGWAYFDRDIYAFWHNAPLPDR